MREESGSQDCGAKDFTPCLDAFRLFANATVPAWQKLVARHAYDFDFGSKMWEGAALSGSSRLLPAPVGKYSVGELRKERTGAFSCSGTGGYSLDIEPMFDTKRNLLRIHPDGGRRGTAGCIGVVCSLTGGADELQKIIYDLYDQQMTPAIELEVLIE